MFVFSLVVILVVDLVLLVNIVMVVFFNRCVIATGEFVAFAKCLVVLATDRVPLLNSVE